MKKPRCTLKKSKKILKSWKGTFFINKSRDTKSDFFHLGGGDDGKTPLAFQQGEKS